jgi:hypothetical protein
MSLLFVGLSILPIALLTLVVALVIARREPDPAGGGIYGVYVFLVSFIALFAVLFAATAAVTAVVKLFQNAPQHSPLGDLGGMMGGGLGSDVLGLGGRFDARAEYWRSLFQSLTLGLAAGAVLWFHARRARELLAEPRGRTDATSRAYRYYLHATLLVAVLVLLFSSASAVYALVRVIAPGVMAAGSSSAERTDGLQQLVGGAFLALASWAIFLFHWRRREEDARPVAEAGPAPTPAGPPPPPPASRS